MKLLLLAGVLLITGCNHDTVALFKCDRALTKSHQQTQELLELGQQAAQIADIALFERDSLQAIVDSIRRH